MGQDSQAQYSELGLSLAADWPIDSVICLLKLCCNHCVIAPTPTGVGDHRLLCYYFIILLLLGSRSYQFDPLGRHLFPVQN